uniref:2-methoxy-6-polyprenyl-1,4-benzoquinol methylase, mitochondrial n=1 Tax=Strombidium inclinatum TaxID=197538 RepID=A0A7S3N1R4_9SPIT|mmetsp:Transcript_33335/g.51085  ORF Transcript_33335/g.51085 Transcript_33335/m.51085 type:complete len:309 (+) Transcript_33335:1-927(+)
MYAAQSLKRLASKRAITAAFPKRALLVRTPAAAFSVDNQQGKKIDFGFETVDYEKKQEKVAEVFSSVADSYDLMNDAMSLGIHRLWKDDFVKQIGPLKPRKILDDKGNIVSTEPLRILDVAGGTGDISFRILDKAWQDSPEQLSVKITVSDINPNMLDVGKKRAVERGSFHELDFKVVNAEDLSEFESDSHDLYTIAFGIRNVTDRAKALKEAHRILRKGGRFMCLEFSEVVVPGLKQIYDTYSFNMIPAMGGLLANDAPSYQYLVESIRKFPKQPEFAAMIEDAGFQVVTYTNYTGGVVALHSGVKL